MGALKWAFAGGILAAIRYGSLGYWVNSYWGGAVPAFAGALVLGALPRWKNHVGPAPALCLGLGLVLLANSRPFEGLVFSIPIATSILLSLRRDSSSRALGKRLRSLAIVAAVLVMGGLAMAYYCWRVTGHPLRLPYQVNQKTYGWPMTLPFFKPAAILHEHRALADYYGWELSEHDKVVRPWRHLFDHTLDGIRLWSFYLGPLLTIFASVGMAGWMRSRVRILVVVSGLAILTAAVEQSRYPHYVAAVTGAVIAIVIRGARIAVTTRRKGFAGEALLGFMILAGLGSSLLRIGMVVSDRGLDRWNTYLSWSRQPPGNLTRAKVEQFLRAEGGRHLVIVRYSNRHKWMEEWVYNEADIDRAPVVWARDMGGEGNSALLDYFQDRRVWLATPEAVPVLRSYPESARHETPEKRLNRR